MQSAAVKPSVGDGQRGPADVHPDHLGVSSMREGGISVPGGCFVKM